MKSRLEDTIVSPEQEVRLRIFDGDIPLENGGVEILKMLIALTGTSNRTLAKMSRHEEYIRAVLDQLRLRPEPQPLTRWQHLKKAVFG